MDDDSADARVAIASFQSAAEAQQALLAVTADGIEAGVRRDSLLGGIWLTLSVSARDVERALGIVQRLWPDEAARLPPAPQLCPRCGAAGSTQLPRILLMLVAAVILIPAGFAVGQVELFVLTFLISAAVLLIIPGVAVLRAENDGALDASLKATTRWKWLRRHARNADQPRPRASTGGASGR